MKSLLHSARLARNFASLFGLVLLLCAQLPALAAPSDAEKAQTVIHMLDYVGVDYPEFVQDGKVLDEAEYLEQKEFAAQSLDLLKQLPEHAQKPQLLAKAGELLARIEAKAPGAEVSSLAADVRGEVMRMYKLARRPPRGA